MAALLHVHMFRQMTLPPEGVAQMIGAAPAPVRPTASWHLGPNGRAVCAWSVHEPEIRGLPPN